VFFLINLVAVMKHAAPNIVVRYCLLRHCRWGKRGA